MTGGIERNFLHLTEIIIGNVLKKKRKCTCKAVWSPTNFSLYHCWIKLRFGNVVLITRIYELTAGIERNTLHWIDIIIGKFMKNKKEMHLQGSLVTVGSC